MTSLIITVEEVFDPEKQRNRLSVKINNLRGDNATDMEKAYVDKTEPLLEQAVMTHITDVDVLSRTSWAETEKSQPPVPSESSVYALGYQTSEGEWCFMHGPTPLLDDLLEERGESSRYRIIRLRDNQQHTVLYVWSMLIRGWLPPDEIETMPK